MNTEKQPAVAGPVEPTVRPGLPVVGCVWGGVVWLVSLRSPKKLDLGARLYTEAELDAAVAAERERCAAKVGEYAQAWWSKHCASNKHMETTRAAHDDFCRLQADIRRN